MSATPLRFRAAWCCGVTSFSVRETTASRSDEDLARRVGSFRRLQGQFFGTVETPQAGIVVKLRKNTRIVGGPPGDRTRDTLIKSQVLYH